jgi:hypothetical protein
MNFCHLKKGKNLKTMKMKAIFRNDEYLAKVSEGGEGVALKVFEKMLC